MVLQTYVLVNLSKMLEKYRYFSIMYLRNIVNLQNYLQKTTSLLKNIYKKNETFDNCEEIHSRELK